MSDDTVKSIPKTKLLQIKKSWTSSRKFLMTRGLPELNVISYKTWKTVIICVKISSLFLTKVHVLPPLILCCSLFVHKENVRKHQCRSCSEIFTRKTNLKNHIASFHSKKRNFKCEFCGVMCYLVIKVDI